jgi:thioredoxin-like negative regulator of GroEL
MEKKLYHFSATWCPACQSMKDDVAAFESEYGSDIELVRFDVDSDEEQFNKYAVKYGFESIPVTIAMVDGYFHRGTRGATTKEDLLALFD